jgi:hypothetical protein
MTNTKYKHQVLDADKETIRAFEAGEIDTVTAMGRIMTAECILTSEDIAAIYEDLSTSHPSQEMRDGALKELNEIKEKKREAIRKATAAIAEHIWKTRDTEAVPKIKVELRSEPTEVITPKVKYERKP